jgi:hypothetical protein
VAFWKEFSGIAGRYPEPDTHRHSLIADCHVELRLLLFRFDPFEAGTIAVAFS